MNCKGIWKKLLLLYIVMISITTVIQYIYKCWYKYNTQAVFVVSGTNGFINFWLRSMAIRGEWHNSYYANHTMLTPSLRAAHLVVFKISVGRNPKNPSFNGPISTHNGRIPNSRLSGPIPTDSFSKSTNSQDHLFWAWCHPHSSPFSCLGVYYDKWWLSYPLCVSVTAPNDYTPGLKRLE